MIRLCLKLGYVFQKLDFTVSARCVSKWRVRACMQTRARARSVLCLLTSPLELPCHAGLVKVGIRASEGEGDRNRPENCKREIVCRAFKADIFISITANIKLRQRKWVFQVSESAREAERNNVRDTGRREAGRPTFPWSWSQNFAGEPLDRTGAWRAAFRILSNQREGKKELLIREQMS